MRMECPFCWQHYEIDEKDANKDFVCVTCEQMFSGRDALILPDGRRSRLGPVVWSAVVLLAALTVMNIHLWREIRTQRAAMEKIELAASLSGNPSKTPPKTPPKDVEPEKPPVLEAPAAVKPEAPAAVKPEAPTVPAIAPKLEALVAKNEAPAPDANGERFRKLEEKLTALSAKYDALYRLNLDTIPKVEAHLNAVTEGLAEVRKQYGLFRGLPERIIRIEQEMAKIQSSLRSAAGK